MAAVSSLSIRMPFTFIEPAVLEITAWLSFLIEPDLTQPVTTVPIP